MIVGTVPVLVIITELVHQVMDLIVLMYGNVRDSVLRIKLAIAILSVHVIMFVQVKLLLKQLVHVINNVHVRLVIKQVVHATNNVQQLVVKLPVHVTNNVLVTLVTKQLVHVINSVLL